ncbi:MAG: sulfotransferase [Rhodobacteraceae bacterium]|nr:sulfotransferase [Paracoccaceae bacterium]
MTGPVSDGLDFTPLVIIGAGRSGTNALRDALTRLPGFATWPCDEINPIWRHGNLDHPDDEIPAHKATPAVRHFIRDRFRRIWRQQGRPDFVVEKTCANALRVPFVDAVLPEARFIHIVRNGFDVVASARRRWRGELEMPGLPYYLAKARYAPVSDLPGYAIAAIRNRLAIRAGRRTHFDSWGPRFAGIETLADLPLDEIVAQQWSACVTASDIAFEQIAPARVVQLHYEDFTADPAGSLDRILQWLGQTRPGSDVAAAAASVRRSSVGKGTAEAEALSDNVHRILRRPMQKHGYIKQGM